MPELSLDISIPGIAVRQYAVAGGGPGAGIDNLLLESGDNFLLESGDALQFES